MAKLKITNKFGVTPNCLLNNKDISMQAKGLFAFIQSKPDDWDFSAEKISIQTKESARSLAAPLKELEKYGYLKRVKKSYGRGKWDIEYHLTSEPFSLDNVSLYENTSYVSTLDDKAPNISNKDLSNKDISNKEKENASLVFFEEVFKFYKTLTTVGSHKGQAGERFKRLSDVKQQKLFEYLKEYSGRRQKIEAAKGWLRPLPAFEKFIRDGYWENVDLPELKREQPKQNAIPKFL